MSLSLHEHLFNLNADVKKDWLRRVGAWDKALTCKAHFVAAIENHLRDQLGAFAELLTEPERNLLAESAHQGRLIGAREFEAKFGAPCPMPTGYREFGEKASLLIPLISRPRYAQEGEPELAAELIEPLRRLFPKPETPPPRTLPGLPKSWPPESERSERDKIRPIRVHESERLAPAELGRVLRLIQGGRLQVAASTRRPTEATVRLVGDALVAPDFLLEPPPKESDQWTETAGPIRAHAWPVLVQQCGWARPHGGTLKLTAEGLAMLRGFSAEAFRAGVNRFLSDGEFDELHRINHLRGQTGKARRWISDPGSRKTTLGEVMDVLPIGEWLAYGEARRLIEASGENWDVVKETAGVL